MRKSKNAKVWIKNRKAELSSKMEPNPFISTITTLIKGPAGFTLIIAAIAYFTGVVDIRKEQLKLEKQELQIDIKNFKEEKKSYTTEIDSLKKHLDSIELEHSKLVSIEENYLAQKKHLNLEISQRKAFEAENLDSKNLLNKYKERIEDYEKRLLNCIEKNAKSTPLKKINDEHHLEEIKMLLKPGSKEQTIDASIVLQKDGSLANFMVFLKNSSSFRKNEYTIEIEDLKTREKCWFISNDETGNKISLSGSKNFSMSILVDKNRKITRNFRITGTAPTEIISIRI